MLFYCRNCDIQNKKIDTILSRSNLCDCERRRILSSMKKAQALLKMPAPFLKYLGELSCVNHI